MPVHVGYGAWRNARPFVGRSGQWRQAQAMWTGYGGQWRQVFVAEITETPHTLSIVSEPGQQPMYIEGGWENPSPNYVVEIEWYIDNSPQVIRALGIGVDSALLFEHEWPSGGLPVFYRVRYALGDVKGPWSIYSNTVLTP